MTHLRTSERAETHERAPLIILSRAPAERFNHGASSITVHEDRRKSIPLIRESIIS